MKLFQTIKLGCSLILRKHNSSLDKLCQYIIDNKDKLEINATNMYSNDIDVVVKLDDLEQYSFEIYPNIFGEVRMINDSDYAVLTNERPTLDTTKNFLKLIVQPALEKYYKNLELDNISKLPDNNHLAFVNRWN